MGYRRAMAATVRCLQIVTFLTVGVAAMTSDKQIINANESPDSLSFFQMTSEGQVVVNVEYDVMMTLPEYRQMYAKPGRRGRRKAESDIGKRWKDCKVHYRIDDSLGLADKELIEKAIDVYKKYTCLNFIEDQGKIQRNHIIFKDGDGCKSYIGMKQGPQEVILARGCRHGHGIIIHEIGHALGLYHEQNRPDRDEFIKINDAAIPERFAINYKKYTMSQIKTYEVPYDYTSIMHYGNTIPGAIMTLHEGFQDKIGQRDGLSFKDIVVVNKMYNCTEMQCGHLPRCPEGGIRLANAKKHKKCSCFCNSGKTTDPLVLCDGHTTVKPTMTPIVVPPEPPVKMGCFDLHDNCADMKAAGKCMTSMEVMMDVCAKTCGTCGKGTDMCMDHEKSCTLAAMSGLCKDPGFEDIMKDKCPASCNFCGKPPSPCEVETAVMSDLQNSCNMLGRFTHYSIVVVVLAHILIKV